MRDFHTLQKLWGHANVTWAKKVKFCEAFVLSTLLYVFATLWLVTAQRRRLDGFQTRCLRRIMGIAPSFYSRVSNASILEQAGVQPLSQQLLHKQLALFGKVAFAAAGDPRRRDTFVGPSLQPQIGSFVRPRQDWTTLVLSEGERVFGLDQLHQLLSDTAEDAEHRWSMASRERYSQKC